MENFQKTITNFNVNIREDGGNCALQSLNTFWKEIYSPFLISIPTITNFNVNIEEKMEKIVHFKV
jgi:hypothetical protein